MAESTSPFYDLQNQPTDSRSDTTVTPTEQSDTEGGSAREEDDGATQTDVKPDTDSTADTEEAESNDTGSAGESSREETTTEETTSSDDDDGKEQRTREAVSEPRTDETESSSDSTEASEPDDSTRDTGSPTETDTILPLMDTGVLRFNVMSLREAQGTDAIDSFARARGGTVAGSGLVSAAEGEQSDYTWFRGSYDYGLLLGAIVFGGMGLVSLIYLARRPRVRVIETANRTANKYLNLNRTKRRGGSVKRSESPPGESAGDGGDNGSINDRNAASEQSSPPWEWSDDRLQKEGIDPDYRSALKMYFQENLTVDQIAERTGRGSGEIGLAIDLVERSTSGA